ncbi:GrrA/OscA1 family cyclophane-containing rSAM-modified RiPP [Gloeothece verrucosa]|uniref:RSAM-associated Gly-rich repeat protein n=1 Tax=Gloeothece verrucosa (strain PCC 7822) TaxID=497965 RepID=E0UHF6_GLOV7|nr:GrrA/OscA1 family cyclophane-containing rSAM-modified RiPP [Gloeothece verrucosa]ADN12097.1 conserved hypothetical protein [Gloeothece verrucosa PCC 7822]
MNITTTTGLVGFLLALSAFNIPSSEAKTLDNSASPVKPTIEQRLAKISATIREQENHLPESAKTDLDTEIAGAWGNGRGRGWVDGSGRRGWVDGSGSRGWANGRNGGGWGNGRDGSWVNGRRWGDGGGFWNRR